MLRDLLAHPLARGLDIDDPKTTLIRREIIASKGFLRRLYQEWYEDIATALPSGAGPVLELGSGGGFLGQHLPGLITSEVFRVPGVEVVLDAHSLPLRRETLRAIVMLDVFHHLREPRRFLTDAARCVRTGGVIAMVEPWVTTWSRQIYSRLHHEPFEPDAATWTFPASGPLSGANGALPWIIFERDRARFESELPQWRIRSIRPGAPIRYLLSGGVSMRSLAPGLAYRAVRWFEGMLEPWMDRCAMFARVVLERTEHEA